MTHRVATLSFVSLWIFAGLGCSASVGATSGSPCRRADRPPECGATCDSTPAGGCGAGFFCTGGHCDADCDYAHGVGCADGQMCTAAGHCTVTGGDGAIVDLGLPPLDAPGPDNTCADVMLGGTHVTPNVILLVDRSGSMHNTFDMGLSRWDVLKNAILQMPGGVVPTLQHSVRFGLALFTGRGTMCPDLVEVLPPALDNYPAISSIYNMYGPGTNTPTGASMSTLVTDLMGMTLPPGPTYIILCTDGEPNTCTDTTDTVGGQMMSEAAAASAHTAGYTVDAIGVSTDVALMNLMRVATAGGGMAYSVTDTTTLVDALNAIVGGAISCDIMLNGMVDPAAACSGTVMLDGMPLGCEDPNGFHVVDSTHITLQGTACDHLTSGGGTVTANFPCTAILH